MRIPLQGHYGRQDTFFPVQVNTSQHSQLLSMLQIQSIGRATSPYLQTGLSIMPWSVWLLQPYSTRVCCSTPLQASCAVLYHMPNRYSHSMSQCCITRVSSRTAPQASCSRMCGHVADCVIGLHRGMACNQHQGWCSLLDLPLVCRLLCTALFS